MSCGKARWRGVPPLERAARPGSLATRTRNDGRHRGAMAAEWVGEAQRSVLRASVPKERAEA